MINIGTKIGERYEIIGNIGSGGMANVYLARDLILNREVAIKVLRFDFQDDQNAIRRFQREALAATEMVHPNIVSVYDVGEENGMQYIVMEYVRGTDLKHYIRNYSPIPLDTVVYMMEQILSAVSLAHEHGIIHRDLKPQNVLVDEQGNVKITDFGIAIALSETSLTQTNTLLGSVHYLSPEQARGGMSTRQSDIYALGIILYELLTGTVPFEGESAVSIALKHFQKDVPSVRQYNPNIPQALENVVLHATAKEVSDRYKTVNEMYSDLSTSLSPERANEPVYTPSSMTEETILLTPVKEPEPVVSKMPLEESELDLSDEEEKPKKSSSSKRKKIIFSVIAVLVAVGVGLFALGTRQNEVAIPDVENMTQAEAINALEAKKIKVNSKIEEVSDDKIAEGNVVRTQPPIGTRVKEKSEVTLYVSKGKKAVSMIDVEGLTASKAKQALIDLGFKEENILEKKESSNDVDKDSVISQSIKQGTDVVPENEKITLTISKGADSFSLAYLAGYTREQVLRYIDSEGLILQSETQEYSATVPQGQVIYTSPSGGTPVKKGDYIQVVYSMGPEPAKTQPSSSTTHSSETTESSETTQSSATDNQGNQNNNQQNQNNGNTKPSQNEPKDKKD
ncbi:Stk1 family PASTA domain-containing Ser/Thr kinase [Vagococcus bubulae]|uniref:non-specific serine/threonine protein kinase n=1 Tax=Vagococcus bubulae TaxID=1977868 RepID=A0A429ZKB8_9ENTE|nr:Stk1 family PASTA domain-containing Ser/Thr kinase [Vagococcus bubulae]RST94109.1 hypothetical protein CBF36_06940 [Vagococcus bubulae]